MAFPGMKIRGVDRGTVLPAFIAVLLILEGCEPGRTRPEGIGSVSTGEAQSADPPEKTAAVRAEASRVGDFTVKLKSIGEAYSENKVVLKSLVQGTIRKLYVAEGQSIKAGDTVLEIDDAEYSLRLVRQEALRLKALSEVILERGSMQIEPFEGDSSTENLCRREREFERTEDLYRQGLLTETDFEEARLRQEQAIIEAGGKKEEIRASAKGLTQAEAEVKLARLEFEKTRIRAPFAGTVTNVRVTNGEHVSAFQEICTLVDPGRVRVMARVLESDIGRIRPNRNADLHFSSYPGETFRGRVRSLGPVVDSADRTCPVYIDIGNASGRIKPGMHAEVEIAVEVFRQKLLVPQESVLVRGGRTMVFVVEGGLAKWRYIEVGRESEKAAEVLAGLEPGEMVITEGHFTLAHDARVRIIH